MITVITYGTFDMFHKGHYNILKRAKDEGDYLIVGVTGDTYDMGRGKLSVHDTLAERIENVKKTGLADKIIVEEYLGQKITDILKYSVDKFVIGDDWRGKFDHLSKYCEMVYLERTQGISSTMLREQNYEKFSIGVVADAVNDNQIVSESKLLKRYDIAGVYSEKESVCQAFKEKYELERSFDDYDALMQASDIVYVRCSLGKRAEYIRKALETGKHVISDTPFTLDAKEHFGLLKLAKENNLILMDNIKMTYIYVFNQLLWMTQGGLIGDILSFNCSISRNDRMRENLFYDLLELALCPVIKIMGTKFENVDVRKAEKDGQTEFASLLMKYKDSTAFVNVGNAVRVKNRLEIIGTKGTIRAGENWWRGNYFELNSSDNDEVKVYSTNFEGNGFKYLLRTLSDMLLEGSTSPRGLFEEEAMAIEEIIEKNLTIKQTRLSVSLKKW